ncbi:sulfur globule family protein [Candidatus Babeliales bacterium]|nr:sulfur globule family protein [Candidatus Babeliales bacterium]
MTQKKYIKYILFFISSLLFSSSLLKASFRGRHCGRRRGRMIRSGPRSAVRVGFSGRGRYRGSGWGYGDRWGGYRGYRRGFFGYSPWDDRRVVVREVYRDDDDDDDYNYKEVDQQGEWIEGTDVKRYQENGITVVKVTLPSLEDSLFSKNDIEYPDLAAISGAYRMNKKTICKDSPSKTEKSSGIRRIVERVDNLNIFDEDRYQNFIKDALRKIKKDRKKRDESTDLDELSMADLESIDRMHRGKVTVGYQGIASSTDSLKTAIKKIVVDIEDGDTQAWALPIYKDGAGWAAVKVEKKDDVVFVIIIKYE